MLSEAGLLAGELLFDQNVIFKNGIVEDFGLFRCLELYCLGFCWFGWAMLCYQMSLWVVIGSLC